MHQCMELFCYSKKMKFIDEAIINVRGGDAETRKLVRSIAHWVSRKTMDVRLRTSVTINISIQKNLYLKEKVQGLSWIDD